MKSILSKMIPIKEKDIRRVNDLLRDGNLPEGYDYALLESSQIFRSQRLRKSGYEHLERSQTIDEVKDLEVEILCRVGIFGEIEALQRDPELPEGSYLRVQDPQEFQGIA